MKEYYFCENIKQGVSVFGTVYLLYLIKMQEDKIITVKTNASVYGHLVQFSEI